MDICCLAKSVSSFVLKNKCSDLIGAFFVIKVTTFKDNKMSNIEIITAAKMIRLETMARPLAEAYRIAFAGSPWFEVSKCPDTTCKTGFCKQEVGEECPGCTAKLVPAYDTQELSLTWRAMLENDDAMMEVEKTEADVPIRATIARPTTPKELWERKYETNPIMKKWLSRQLPPSLVWIEDTFADRSRRERGNLKQRGATLARVATYYGGLPIYTRTIAPQIVAATLRDVTDTAVFVGTTDTEAIEAIVRAKRPELGNGLVVPDQRTLLAINALRNAS
jgi:hypothetical protein